MDDVDLEQVKSEGEYDEEDDDSDYYQSSNQDQQLNTSRISHVSNSTFRDTQLSEIDALKTMRIQSLTSIVNVP